MKILRTLTYTDGWKEPLSPAKFTLYFSLFFFYISRSIRRVFTEAQILSTPKLPKQPHNPLAGPSSPDHLHTVNLRTIFLLQPASPAGHPSLGDKSPLFLLPMSRLFETFDANLDKQVIGLYSVHIKTTRTKDSICH